MSDNYEQPVEPMSRVEDILRGDATVHPMSRVEALLKELIEAGGGGGGSTVVVTPIQQSGAKIANISVNGVGYDIYAPEGSSGSVVTIDPEYQSGTLLATLTIDSTNYYIYAPSGGGTTVVANPEGEATDTLEKIQIGNGIYSVEGGGSSGPAYTETSLWSGNDSSTMELSESFQNFDEIRVVASCYISNTDKHYRLTSTWSVSDLKKHINDGIRFGTCGDNWFIYFTITDNTTFTKADQNITYISEIIGIKYGISVSTPFDEEDLWVNPDGSGIGTYTLAHSIDDYDFLAIYYGLYDEYTSGILVSDYRLVSVDDLKRLHTEGKKLLITGWQNRTIYIDFNQATMVISTTENGNTVLRVRGIKLPKGEGTNGGSTETTLYSQTPGAWPSTLTLSDSYKNYDRLQFYIYKYDASNYYDHLAVQEISTDQLDMIQNGYISGRTNVLQISGWHRSDQYIRYSIANNTTFTKVQSGGDWGLIKVVGVKFGGSSTDISCPNSEIIPLGPGNGTTTRTFNLQRTPKKVSIYWYEDYTGEYDQNWGSYYSFIWGQTRAYGLGGGDDVAAQSQLGKVAYISYGQDGKSFSLTGGNEGSACNTSNPKHHGYLYLEYGSGVESPSIGDYTWTQILSGNPATIALPDEYTKLILTATVGNNVEFCGVIDVAEMKKTLQISGKTLYSYSNNWNDGIGNHDVTYFNYDGTNIGIGSTYSGVTAILYGVKVTYNNGGSEIIDIPAGSGTTSRTFTFGRVPKFIKIYWIDPVVEGGWSTDATLVWGQTYINYVSNRTTLSIGGTDGGMATIAYGQDGKSFTITAVNTFGAWNSTGGTGKMYVEY